MFHVHKLLVCSLDLRVISNGPWFYRRIASPFVLSGHHGLVPCFVLCPGSVAYDGSFPLVCFQVGL